MEGLKRTGGYASKFDTGYLRYNLVGTKFKGSTVIGVSCRNIKTEDATYKRKGLMIQFIEKEDSLKYCRPDTSYDGCENH